MDCARWTGFAIAVALSSVLIFADLCGPLAQAVAPQASLDSDITNQVDGDNASHECTLSNPCTASNLIPINPGTVYWAGADELGSCQDATYQWSLQSANGTELFRVRNDGTNVLNGWTTGTIVRLGSAGFRGRPFTIVQFSVSVSTSVKLVPMLGGSCNSFTTTGFARVTLPPGVSNETQLMGYAGAWYVQCCPLQPSGILLQQDALLSEVGIESTEATTNAHVGSVIGTGFNAANTMQQINSEYALVSVSATTNAGAQEVVQSFTPDASKGAYVGHVTFSLQANNAPSCSGTVSISVSNVDMVSAGGAWNTSNESANLTATLTKGTSSGTFPATVTVDLVNGTITDTSNANVYTGVTLSVGGSSSGVSSSMLAPYVATSATSFFRFFSTVTCSDASLLQPRMTTTSAYSGGTAFTRTAGSTGAFTTQPGDAGMTLNVYGGTTYSYTLAATPQNVGGSFYVYVYEIIRDATPQQYTLSTSFGGSGRVGSYQYASGSSTQQVNCHNWYFVQKCVNGLATSCPDNSCVVLQEWRLGYQTPAWTSTQTWTLTVNDTGSGRNQLFVAIINTANEPAHPHLGSVSWTPATSGFAAVQTYQFFSTDDYYANVQVTVKQCLDANCATLGDLVTTANYVATICSGGFARSLAGGVDASASFNITGQDLPGCTLTVVLGGSGYVQTPWTLSIAVPGNYSYTLGLLTPTAISMQPTLASATITFDGNTTRTIPDRVQINVTRSRSVSLFVGADHVDPTTGVVQHNVVRATFWDASASNTFNFYYPTRAKSGPQDKGGYILWVMNDTGVVLGYTKFFLEPAGVSWTSDDFTITSDMLLAISQAGYVSAQQSYQQSFQASILAQQKTVRDQIYEDFQNLHNYGAFFLAILGALAVVRAFRR